MEGKVVLITGASSGIGAGTAVHFASKGCLLALTGRSQEGLRETLEACLQAGAKEDQVLLIPADLQVMDSLADIVDQTVDKFGKLDVLVNNAGYSKLVDFENTTEEDYDTLMNTNAKAAFFLTQRAMPHLIRSKGNVVNVSSAASQRPMPIFIAYCASKANLEHFSRTLALHVAAKGVRVNAVCPGMVDTPIMERLGIKDTAEELAKRTHAIGRYGTVEEMANTIAFLADNQQSSFITGATLVADGGQTLMGPM